MLCDKTQFSSILLFVSPLDCTIETGTYVLTIRLEAFVYVCNSLLG